MTDKKTLLIEYTEDQRPCIIARKPCGCAVAAFGIDVEDLQELKDLEPDTAVINFLREFAGCTLEFRPTEFVRAGGLTFGCRHKARP